MSSLKPLLKPDVTLSLALSPSPAHDHEILKPEERGIRLIQLLLKGAKHASSGNFHRADACLSEISELSSMSGDSMQRLAAQFASALATRLVKRWPGLYKALNHHQKPRIDVDQAKTLFARAFPFLCFAYMVITRTLVQAMANEHVIHIVDLSSGDPKLWVPFLHSLAHLPNGPPHLKITCLNSNRAILDKLGQSLVKEAETLDMPFQFNPLSIGLRELSGDMLKVRSGEALAFVSILNLHVLLAEDDQVDAHFGGAKFNGIKSCKPLSDLLTLIRSMSPKLLFLVEQEANHNLDRLVDRFIEGLHYYSAVFDSIDATSGNLGGEGRMILEEMFGREIENIVACEGLERFERHERYGRWAIRLGQGGFKPIRLWYNFNEDTKQMVDGFGKGYKIASEKTSLMICWHERPLYAVTAWTC
ncbi:hypothetical protein P3X46_029643 [Hevea brasiliensis]|uniref:Scarecrow-like protein 3 n=1 Tax=Hevea brasiliensis TaxID=3981 RepID=A0ABQ9KUC3_HEVBR|nr:scarecrow-like protein 3 [Hevea brasiliensis]KAJ9147487.1 hypothetical protein P3X46_029643 [Hevea brasiliensis]